MSSGIPEKELKVPRSIPDGFKPKDPAVPDGELLPGGVFKNRVYVPLGGFGSPEAELLVLHAIFRCDGATRAFATLVIRYTDKTPAGSTKDEFLALPGTARVGRASRAQTFPSGHFHT
jgi:hypothetical protein